MSRALGQILGIHVGAVGALLICFLGGQMPVEPGGAQRQILLLVVSSVCLPARPCTHITPKWSLHGYWESGGGSTEGGGGSVLGGPGPGAENRPGPQLHWSRSIAEQVVE